VIPGDPFIHSTYLAVPGDNTIQWD
jgi:hypothetical protein